MNARRRALSLCCALVCLLCFSSPAPAADGAHPRIVSLVPSLTEMLFAMGAGSQVVAVSDFTTYPAAATALPVVGNFTSVDSERVVALHPDLVVAIPAQRTQVQDLERAGVRVELLPDDSFESIFSNLKALGRLSGHPGAAGALANRLHERTARLQRSVRHTGRSVFVVLQVAPIYTVGNLSFIAHLIELAGGSNAAGALHAAYGRFSEEALVALQPAVIVVDPASGFKGMSVRPPWNALHAVRSRHVYYLDNPDVLLRPGPRYNEGLAWLIARLGN